MEQKEKREFLIRTLKAENNQYKSLHIPEGEEEQRTLLRGLMNVRMPGAISAESLKVQDEYLKEEIRRKGITDAADLPEVQPGICLWQGDITTLKCNAVVNAANSGMTGCYIPNHRCIDNCIHSFAGIQLRLECAQLMEQQGFPEPTGKAKITNAWNLPCRYILHTVGPVINGPLTDEDCRLLSSCYRSCLELAAEYKLESIAFCCISTGEFHFPNGKAAEIAVRTVKDFMTEETSIKKVVFNVFKDTDRRIYERILGAD